MQEPLELTVIVILLIDVSNPHDHDQASLHKPLIAVVETQVTSKFTATTFRDTPLFNLNSRAPLSTGFFSLNRATGTLAELGESSADGPCTSDPKGLWNLVCVRRLEDGARWRLCRGRCRIGALRSLVSHVVVNLCKLMTVFCFMLRVPCTL